MYIYRSYSLNTFSGVHYRPGDILKLAAALPRDLADRIEEYVASIEFNLVQVTDTCVCMTYEILMLIRILS